MKNLALAGLFVSCIRQRSECSSHTAMHTSVKDLVDGEVQLASTRRGGNITLRHAEIGTYADAPL